MGKIGADGAVESGLFKLSFSHLVTFPKWSYIEQDLNSNGQL